LLGGSYLSPPCLSTTPTAGASLLAFSRSLLLLSCSNRCSSSALALAASRSAFFAASLACRSLMISVGSRIRGEPVGAGAFGWILVDPLLPTRPLPTGADDPGPMRSDIEAFSSSSSGVKGFGVRSATSSAYKIADAVRLETRTAGCRASLGEDCCAVGVESRSSERSRWSCWYSLCRPCCSANLTCGGLGDMPTEAASMCVRRGGDGS
jgi:hypothetical protein